MELGSRSYKPPHITLGGFSTEIYSNDKQFRRKSCWRIWNQLSSLQRSFIILLLISFLILIVYVGPFFSWSQAETADKVFIRHAVEEIHQKAKARLAQLQKDKTLLPPSRIVQGIPVNENPINSSKLSFNPAEVYSGPKNPKQLAVVQAFQHAWRAYEKYAWGHDELKPLSKSYSEWFGIGLTIIDSLDTMYIMGLKNEFNKAKDWVTSSLNLDSGRDVNLFETTIRGVGGLLSAYTLSREKIFLEKAVDLGNRLLPAFNTGGSNVPFADVNLHSHRAHGPAWGPDSSTAEVATIQLEFIELTRLTGDPKYQQRVMNVSVHIKNLPKKGGLVPMFINTQNGNFRPGATITLGARADTYYEYLLKMWLQNNKKQNWLKDDFITAIGGIRQYLLKRSKPNGLVYIGELLGGNAYSPKMDELACFLAGTLALGWKNGLPADHLSLAEDLAFTCWQMYERMATGLAPEIAYFNTVPGVNEDIIVKPADTHNLLRPETIESFFYLHRITGKKKYRDWGWKIFQAFEKYTKLPEGYSSISNVRDPNNVRPRDKMESFFLGETLKYFYLLFSDDPHLLPLDKFVFNTEAHPLPIPDP